MYSDFFDPPEADAAGDDRVSDADKMDESMEYSSDDKETGVSGEKHSDEGKVDETSDDDESADGDGGVEQPPVKKAKHRLLADEWVSEVSV